jgi:membrane protein implicated in regulation of membrane protease activity
MESLIEYFIANPDKLLYTLAGICLVVELSVLGLSGPLLFFGIGCVITGLFVSIGLLESWIPIIVSVGIVTGITTLLLWKPLKSFQGPKNVRDTSSDMIGQTVPVSETVTRNGGSIRHSGINWQSRLDVNVSVDEIVSGERAEISAVEGNVMIIKPLS